MESSANNIRGHRRECWPPFHYYPNNRRTTPWSRGNEGYFPVYENIDLEIQRQQEEFFSGYFNWYTRWFNRTNHNRPPYISRPQIATTTCQNDALKVATRTDEQSNSSTSSNKRKRSANVQRNDQPLEACEESNKSPVLLSSAKESPYNYITIDMIDTKKSYLKPEFSKVKDVAIDSPEIIVIDDESDDDVIEIKKIIPFIDLTKH